MASASNPNELARQQLLMGEGANRLQRIGALLGHGLLLTITSVSALSVIFIFFFILRDALPFVRGADLKQFFASTSWYPSADPPEFGSLAIFYGSLMVTLGAVVIATPLGVAAAVCLSDILPFKVRQFVKPVIEMLAAIPSVAYGFFALVVFAPLLQNHGGPILAVAFWMLGVPLAVLATAVISDLSTTMLSEEAYRRARVVVMAIVGTLFMAFLAWAGQAIWGLEIHSGTNALNVSIILAIMALPTVVSVSEDALSATGRELREGSYALGATRAETLVKVIIPAASSGILAAVLLGIMRAIGETMVVWMAAGNASRIPEPFYNYLTPMRTLTATIAGDMAETAYGTTHYHSLFMMAACLLVFSLVCNLLSEWAVRRARLKVAGG